ncbi:MAG: 2-oxoglutarate dehydrogenase, E2 component, dihydrolipoamide succinyltransferase [Acidobacteria bacterium]|jgi:pyruvate dehydrogenase E2 component (dihydrolipoamide acetyltransferase)|nr:2-oxoglutarate dehydrogenase, E2 component, dihydrolipoamide succinyltransferase [Bryobacteraceae bacterium CoA2 C42]MCA2962976.1 2-oxoglutarate dehydrogenase, E2 component, dihydrolipoamide succinyltransferase [Acidobacteriaceae bacterium]
MIDVVMPQMGESIVEGTLTRWLKKPGDKVERDEPLFEISTDKVDTEIPSPAAGTLAETLFEAGAVISINTVVARISDGVAAPAPAPVAAAPAPEPPPAPPAPALVAAAPAPPPPAPAAEPAEADFGLLSPLVRKMARENSIDLANVKGTGAGGRITKEDLESYLAAKAAPAPAPAAPAPAPAAAPAPAPVAAAAPPPPARAEAAKYRIEPMSTMRQKIAEHMIVSQTTSANVTTVHKVDMTSVAKLRDRQKDAFKAQYGYSLTFLPFVLAATAKALREFPIFNASIDGKNIVYHNDINIGIAVALDGGLIVPVIQHADEKNVVGLQREIVDLAARARSKNLKPADIQGGTFSVTNFGSFGSVFATPMINQPNVAILGVGTVEKQPVVINDAIAIRSICYLANTFDHRLIDGALADQFTGRVKQLLENWSDSVL